MGNTYEFPPERKEDMKSFALYFIAVFGILICWLQYYLYVVVRAWAARDMVIEYSKEKRMASARASARGLSKRGASARKYQSARR